MRRRKVNVKDTQNYICVVLALHGPQTDEELWDRWLRQKAGLSYGMMQKRRLELIKAGRIVDSGERRCSWWARRSAIVWRVV